MSGSAPAAPVLALDEVDDPRQGRVPAQPRHRHVQGATAVDRPAEHFVAPAPVERQRFAGDRRLVLGGSRERARSRRAESLPGLMTSTSPTSIASMGTMRSVPSRRTDASAGARSINARTGAAGKFHGSSCFEHWGQGEEKHDPPRPSACSPSAYRVRNRHHHEHVNVEAAGGNRRPGRGAPSECRRDADRSNVGKEPHEGRRAPQLQGQAKCEINTPDGPRSRSRWRRTLKVGAAPRVATGAHARLRDGLQRSGRSSVWRRLTGFGGAGRRRRRRQGFETGERLPNRCLRISDFLVVVDSLDLEDRSRRASSQTGQSAIS